MNNNDFMNNVYDVSGCKDSRRWRGSSAISAARVVRDSKSVKSRRTDSELKNGRSKIMPELRMELYGIYVSV